MITCNSLSGGKTSSFMAIHFPADYEIFACVEQEAIGWSTKERMSSQWEILKYKRRDAHEWLRRFNQDFICSAEDDRTLIAVHQLSRELETDNRGRFSSKGKIDVVFARNWGKTKYKTYDDIVKDYIPNSRKRLCTEVLKIEPMYNYIRNIISKVEPLEMRLGFRLDELDRTVNIFFKVVEIKKRVPNPGFDLQTVINLCKIPDYLVRWWDIMNIEGSVRKGERVFKKVPFNYYKSDFYRVPSFPLIEAGITNVDVIKYWSKRKDYDFPKISNCSMCFHHTIPELKRQFIDPLARAKMKWAIEAELMKGHTFKRLSQKGKSRPITMEYIMNLPLQTQMEFMDDSSCDAGSCSD